MTKKIDNGLSIQDMYDAMTLDRTTLVDEQGEEIPLPFCHLPAKEFKLNMDLLYQVEAFVDAIAKTDKLAYTVREDAAGWKRLTAFLPLSKFIKLLRDKPSFHDTDLVSYSEYIDVFNRSLAQLDSELDYKLSNIKTIHLFPFMSKSSSDHFKFLIDNKTVGEVFNNFTVIIRTMLKEEGTKNKINWRVRNWSRNQKSAIKYVHRLCDVYSIMLVIRIDLGFREEYWGSLTPEIVRGYFKRFMSNRRSKPSFFGSQVGYIWKLEEGGVAKHLHYHVVLFFDGSKKRSDVYLTEQIGEYWENVITKGWGKYHSCNMNKNKYKRNGIGMVHCNDTQKREYLVEAVNYLTKSEQYLRLKMNGMRSFGHGNLPPLPTSKVGRPRTKGSPAS